VESFSACYNSAMPTPAEPTPYGVYLYTRSKTGRVLATRPRPKRRARPKAARPGPVEPEREDAASSVRGVLIARLDDLAAERVMGVAKEQFGIEGDAWIRLLQMIQVAMFPEEFAPRPPVSYREAGLIPGRGRLEKVAAVDYARFAAKFLSGAG
jgi:hypothetical protein